jgi:chromosome segregation ATPase
MTERMPNAFASPEAAAPAAPSAAASDIEAATRRLAAALDALESAVERRREYDRGGDELAARIQALGIDRSRLANELDDTLVRSRELERTNREIAERLDVAIGTIRSVIEGDAS